MKKALIASIATLALAGCATQSYNLQSTSKTTPDYQKSQTFFFHGIGQQQVTYANHICRGYENIAKVQTYESALDIFLRVLTAGFYTPRTVAVYCK